MRPEQSIANCPTPEYHSTHRYCPSCPWTEPQEPTIQVVDLPEHIQAEVDGWLRSNQREAVEVRHGVFPLGMVQLWIERAKDAEPQRDGALRELRRVEEVRANSERVALEALALAEEVYGWDIHEPNHHRLLRRVTDLRAKLRGES